MTAEEAKDDKKLLGLLPRKLQRDILDHGVTAPRLLAGTVDEGYVIAAMNVISMLALWVHPFLPLSPLQFLADICGFQVFDSLRMFRVDQGQSNNSSIPLPYSMNILGCHGDKKNSKSRRFVMALKYKSDLGQVTGFIGYTRQIADTVVNKIQLHKILFDDMVHYFDHIPKGSQGMNKVTLQQSVECKNAQIMPSIRGCPPNLNCTFSFMGIVHATIMMTSQFDLSYLEIASVLCCYDFAAECSYYFIAASIFFLKFCDKENRSKGIAFGYDFLNYIRSLHEYEKTQSKGGKSIVGMFNRYASNNTDCSYNKREFEQLVYSRVLLCLSIFLEHPDKPSNKDVKSKAYKNYLMIFAHYAKKVNELIGGHGLAMWSVMGLMPTWLRTF